MVRYAHTDRPTALVLQTARRLTRGLQDKRVRARNTRLEQAELPRVQSRVMPNLVQIGTDQCEVVVAVRSPDASHSLEGVLVVDMAAERVTGIRGVGNDPTLSHDLRGTANRPPLGIDGVELEIFRYLSGDRRRRHQGIFGV